MRWATVYCSVMILLVIFLNLTILSIFGQLMSALNFCDKFGIDGVIPIEIF